MYIKLPYLLNVYAFVCQLYFNGAGGRSEGKKCLKASAKEAGSIPSFYLADSALKRGLEFAKATDLIRSGVGPPCLPYLQITLEGIWAFTSWGGVA